MILKDCWMSDAFYLSEATSAPWKIPGAPQTCQSRDEDPVGTILETFDGADMIDHALAQRSVGKPKPVAVDRDDEFQRSFLGVDGNDPVTGSEGV